MNSILVRISLALSICISTVGCNSTFSPIVTRSEFQFSRGYDIAKTQSLWIAPPTVEQIDFNLYKISIIGFKAVEAEMVRQDSCWAACVQMIRNFNGDDIAQADILKEIKGEIGENDDASGSAIDIIRSLSGP